MDYQFENLGDERFQEFCSAIISKEYPNIQAFPVGQPDGGRDAVTYIDTKSSQFYVFQVKYVRNVNTMKDPHKWLLEIIKEEAPKIDKLITKGAVKFFLLTNVKGTAHSQNGSIDKLQSILDEKINIPSICWWRDDLKTLFEKDPLFKWSFPEILNGQDILNAGLFTYLHENKERRESTITAYLADQYMLDNEVKFKQIDLRNKLFDLFTDLPISFKKNNQRKNKLNKLIHLFENVNYTSEKDEIFIEKQEINAADFLLNKVFQNNDIDRILIEGGPGQGKSTITQFICQVNRAKLLRKTEDLDSLAPYLKKGPIRLPFKIDLRHLAAWIEKNNPYPSVIPEIIFEQIWKKSLESFLVGNILYHSSASEFTIEDLNSIFKNSSILLVFDGFDEIADLNIRKEVVELLNKGYNRLKEISKSMLFVITSRPAAFTETVVFSENEYPHFQLSDITDNTISNYVEKWIKASSLDEREGSEITKLVKEKLKLPHLRDLTTSPMQLAIFISLLRTKGESLPNKRTALYDSYIELFFDRESEKSKTIRENRDLIIDIHEYIAWILHSEAELYGNGGSIEIGELQNKLKFYLKKEEHNPNLAEELFTVVSERVCALVSRVQGTYEFEVQPLREYFCAKYLYKSSPYAHPGTCAKGTKPERFNAIAKNMYWQNVVRFFAGCFDKGELPMLIHELKEIKAEENLQYTNYPSIITSKIMSDWVFTHYPKLLKDVIKIILEGINLGNIVSKKEVLNYGEKLSLPFDCGRKEIFEECFNLLKEFPKPDYADELILLINNNSYSTEKAWLLEAKNLNKSKLTRWFEYGYHLGIFHKIDSGELEGLTMKDDIKYIKQKANILFKANRFKIIDHNIKIKNIILDNLLSLNSSFVFHHNISTSLQYFNLISHPFIFYQILEIHNKELNFSEFLNWQYTKRFGHKKPIEFSCNDEIDYKIKIIYEKTKKLKSPLIDWKSSVSHWEDFIYIIEEQFGRTTFTKAISMLAAGIRSREEKYDEYDNLDIDDKNICKRVRCARLKSGNFHFWEKQLSTKNNLPLKLAILLMYGTVKTLTNMLEKITKTLQNMPIAELKEIDLLLSYSSKDNQFSKKQSSEYYNFYDKNSPIDIFKYFISKRLPVDLKSIEHFNDINTSAAIFSKSITSKKLSFLLDKFLKQPNDIEALSLIREYYLKITFEDSNPHPFRTGYYTNYNEQIPLDIARNIMKNPKEFPRIITLYAEQSCFKFASENSIPVGRIAQENHWFLNENMKDDNSHN